jgi:DNA-binding CsgD family transcriptional regulator
MENGAHRPDAQHLFAVQADLRDRLLHPGRLSRESRGVAAEMLLYLDDPAACWTVCTSWLLSQTGADRVDGGFARAADPVYTPRIERRRDDIELPSVLGARFHTGEEAIRTVWGAERAIVFHNAQDDRRISAPMRSALLSVGTRSKIAIAVRDRGRDVGLVCVDSHRAFAWSADDCEHADHLAREVMGPILGAAQELAQGPSNAPSSLPSRTCLPGLTPAETRVAELVLAGCSYKEIARKLDRSCSTIDHQLRSMRQKLGVNSTAKLMRELSQIAGVPLAA